jgi:hypothetical protein
MSNSKQYISGSTRTADVILSDTEPTSPFPCMIWSDLTAGVIKVRNLGNTDWEIIGTVIGNSFYQPTVDAGFNSVQGILGLKLGTWGSASFSITEDASKIYLTGHVAKDIEITPYSGNTVSVAGNDIADIMSALSTLATGYTGTLTVVTDVSLDAGVLTKTTKVLTFSGGRLQSIT